MSEASITHNHAAGDVNDVVDRYRQPLLLAGGLGLLILIVGGLASGGGEERGVLALRAYLLGFIFFVGVPMGCLGFVMLQNLTGGRWGMAIRRICEAASRLIYVMPIFFIPIALGVHKLYPWANPAYHTEGEFKRHWLTPSFFLIRAVIYFAIWIILTLLLNKWSADQDRTNDARATRKMQLLSGPGILIYVTSMTFAVFDWVMSLDPDWYSTIFGLIFIVGQALSALCLCAVVLSLLKDRRPFAGVIGAQQFHDVGNLMLTFTMLWAYMSFSQLLITWSGNVNEETPYYYQRLVTGWRWIGLFVITFHFAVPFMLLLNRPLKRNIDMLVRIALLLIFMRFMDLKWSMGPAFAKPIIHSDLSLEHIGGFACGGMSWMDPFAVIGVGGIWLWLFFGQLKKWPLIPPHDPRLLEVAHHHG